MKRERNPRGKGHLLREQLLEAAERALLAGGSMDSVTIQTLCDSVGCSAPALYRHFPDKTALVHEVCATFFARYQDAIAQATATAVDPLDALWRRGMAYVRFGLDHPELYRVLFMHRPENPPRPMAPGDGIGASSMFDALVGDVRAAVRAGVLSGEVHTLACQIWMGVHGITALLITRPSFPWPDSQDFVAASVRRLLINCGG